MNLPPSPERGKFGECVYLLRVSAGETGIPLIQIDGKGNATCQRQRIETIMQGQPVTVRDGDGYYLRINGLE